jgi:hypothetical protein
MDAADRWVASEHQRADDLVKIREEEALKAFKVAQQTKIAAATVAAALNAIELTGALIPTLGVGAPFAAAAIAAGQLALTIAQIKATEPPTFALGGSVAARMGGGADHALISASPAEGIVSPRGMMALGQTAGHDGAWPRGPGRVEPRHDTGNQRVDHAGPPDHRVGGRGLDQPRRAGGQCG